MTKLMMILSVVAIFATGFVTGFMWSYHRLHIVFEERSIR